MYSILDFPACSATFINVGRGSCVDEAALVTALKERRISGASLDVFEEEPVRAQERVCC